MSILGIVLVIVVLAVAFYLVSRYVPDPFRWVALLILGVIVIVWVVQVLGLGGTRI